MADVFISYKQTDRELVEPLIQKIEASGFSVWWDSDIKPTGEWDESTEHEIETASVVLVLWTYDSVKSKWVRTEAHYGNQRKKLVPARLDGCDLPLAFLLNQTADLSAWNGDDDDIQWHKLLSWIEELVNRQRSDDSSELEKNNSKGKSADQWRATYGETESGEVIFDGVTVSRRTPGGTYFRDAPDLPLMTVIPEGVFTMGSPNDEVDHRDSEEPQRLVRITSPFAIGVYLLTFDEWQSLHSKNLVTEPPVDAGWGAGRRPVINVSWVDAVKFVEVLAGLTGLPYRLPSEAEWEYSCRAGATGPYGFTESIRMEMANYDGTQDGQGGKQLGQTRPVGSYDANRYGLYDMHGNVREWVQDRWHDNYIDAPGDGLAWNSGHSAMRVLRGGSWLDAAWFLRSAARGRGGEHDRTPFIGFRVARDIP